MKVVGLPDTIDAPYAKYNEIRNENEYDIPFIKQVNHLIHIL